MCLILFAYKAKPGYDLFSILENRETPPDETLPDTGMELETERMLSPIFIESAN